MTDIIFVVTLGSILGMFAGLVPGVGIFASLIMIYPFLITLTPMETILLYIALACATQYFGSVTAIYFGVPGESSSLPAVIEGHALYGQGRAHEAIVFSSIGSFLGSFVGVVFFGLLAFMLSGFFPTSLQQFLALAIIGFASTLLIKNSIRAKILMFVIPLLIAHLGMPGINVTPKFNFGIDFLKYGIHYFPIILGLICAKQIIFSETVNSSNAQKNKANPLDFLRYKLSFIRGCVVGGFGGMVPGLTTMASSNFSYSLEKRMSENHHDKSMRCLVSAETANNVGSITQLLPLLLFGLPITASETVLYNVIQSKGWLPGGDNFWNVLSVGWPVLLVANLMMLLLSWRYAWTLTKLIPKNGTMFKTIMLVICAFLSYYVGDLIAKEGLKFLIIFFLCLPFAAVSKNTNYMPLAFWLVIGENLLDNFYRLIFQLY